MAQTDTWVVLTPADVQNALNQDELAVMQSAGGNAGAPLTGLIADATDEVRGYCRRRNTLGADGTIPRELKNPAIDLVIYRLMKRVSGASGTEGRRKDHDSAIETLQRVATGEFLISAPLTPTTSVTSAPSPQIAEKHHRFGYNKERGI